MNGTVLTGILSLVIGIGVGWLLKPGPEDASLPSGPAAPPPNRGDSPPAGAPAKSAGGPPGKALDPDQPPGPGALPRNGFQRGQRSGVFGQFVELTPEETALARASFRTHFNDEHADQLSSLVHELGLSDKQQESLQARYFDRLLEHTVFKSYPREGEVEPPFPPDLGKLFGEILSEEQAAAYEELRKRHRRQFIEAETLESMAELTFLDLTGKQQNAVYDLIYKELDAEIQAESGAVGGPPSGALAGAIIGNNGGDGNAGRGALIGAEIGNPPADLEEAVARERAKNISSELDRFREILSEDQLKVYRHHIDRQHQGTIYAPFSHDLPPLQR